MAKSFNERYRNHSNFNLGENERSVSKSIANYRIADMRADFRDAI